MNSKMFRGNEGFTIIEVTIFLGISGLLLLAMFLGTGSVAARQRFTDTTDSLLTFFQAQYDEIVNGVNVRGESTTTCPDDSGATVRAGKSQCYLLGKLMTISSSGRTVQSSYVISTTESTTVTTDPKIKLRESTPAVVTIGQATYEVKWGANIPKATRSGATPRQNVNSIAFLRVPDTGRIIQLYYSNTSATETNGLRAALNDPSAFSPAGTDSDPSLAVCVQNTADFPIAGPKSSINFGQGLGAGTITTNFNPGALCT